jgi:hypothetical protein
MWIESALTARERRRIAWSKEADTVVVPAKADALREASSALDAAKAPHALIGGVAAGTRSGVPRATLGTDVAVGATVRREHVVQALTAVGFVLRGTFAHSANLRHPSGEPVRIVFDRQLDPIIDRAERVDLGEYTVPGRI